MTRRLIGWILLGWALWATDADGNPTYILRRFHDAGPCIEASYRLALFTGQTSSCLIDYSL